MKMGAPSLSEEERNKRLVEAGNELLHQELPFSKEDLPEKLDNLEHLLSMVEQVPPASARSAFQPAMEALVADELLRHPDIDVKVSVASCISQIMRITAPEQPYDDSILKVFFELAVLAFGKLACMDNHCYSKAVSILEVLVKYRTCVLMLDLELDALVVQMFQHFLNGIRPDHPDHVLMDIEEMMSMIIIECDIISVELLSILIGSVKKENQNVSPRSYMLGERVLKNSAVKLQPYLPQAVRSLSISTDDYSEVVELICTENAKKPLPSSRWGQIDQSVDGKSKPQVENGGAEPSHKVACSDDVSLFTEENSKCLPDTDSTVAAADDNVVLFGQSVVNTFKSPLSNDSQELSQNASYDGKVGPSLLGSSKLPTNDGSIELAPHAVCEKVTPSSRQSSDLLEKDVPKHEENDIVPEMDTALKGSQCGDATKQHKSTDSRTGSRSENLGSIYAVDKELDREATQASKKRGWKPNLLKKPEEGYDHVWLSGERRSKAHLQFKDYEKDTKKRSSCSPKRAILNELYLSSGVDKTQIMTSIRRRQRDKNDKIGQQDGAKFSSISARDSPGALTKKNISQPTLCSSEEFAILEALEKKHETDGKKNVPVRYRDKKRRSSIGESGIQGLGSVSITKKGNSAKTSKEQRKKKNSPSQEDALGSVSITKGIKFAKTSKEQREGKNSPSQKGSAHKVVREHDEYLVGCRVRVWWPLDQTFYEGQISSFDSSKRRHMVLYDDGEQEILDLTNECWELVGDDSASDPRQEIVHGLSDSSDMHLGCIIDSYRHLRKKKKVLNVADVVPMLTPGAESKKTASSKAKLYRVKATDDLIPPSTMTMQHNSTAKGVHQKKRIKVESSECGIEGNPISWTRRRKASPGSSIEDSDACSELVDVHGYKVKTSSAPTLAAIFAKYGDIAVNCQYKSPAVRASLLEVVSDVVRQLKNTDIDANFSAIKAMKSVVSDASDAKLEVSWLQQYLEEIPEEEDMKSSSYLMALRVTTKLVTEAAKKDLVETNQEVLAAEKRFKKAERRLQEAQSRAAEAERSVKVFEILGEKIQQDVKESKDQAQYWQSSRNELL